MKQSYLKEYPDDGSGIPQVDIRPVGRVVDEGLLKEGFRIVGDEELAPIRAKLPGGKDYIEPKSKVEELEERVKALEEKKVVAKDGLA
jgi:hypothetical protein